MTSFATAEPTSPLLVAVCNHKGGVAKTTTCVNLAAGLVTAGQTVAVADFDSLATASRILGINTARIGTYEVITGRCSIETAFLPTSQAGIWVLPSTPTLHLAEIEPEVISLNAERLRARLTATERCDTILIDCPPSLGAIAVNVIAAADLMLVPVQPTTFARDGLERTLEIFAACRSTQPRLAPRILITMADINDSSVRRIIDQIRHDHGDQVYPTAIPFDSSDKGLATTFVSSTDSAIATAYLRATLALLRDQRLCRAAAMRQQQGVLEIQPADTAQLSLPIQPPVPPAVAVEPARRETDNKENRAP
ncbi:ParA family protein [Magnetospirillum molischianum]|uniref:Putative Cobyrinic acid ac-diamide synthase n=1 Tax=Magnetospirillum molischianum DSM 120 TaxID=1150626 RepID=H8FWC9_MAGML|nr:ParA family protein [Magnetospirillum molischianum]CCG42667.1 putative Cobyrinic acid ac-diamide synthase [Magnetospirillum molischianum DSM 120]